jgi:hypothetical protein
MATPGTISLETIYDRMTTYGSPHFGLLRIGAAIKEWPINLDPDFQRGHVWTQANQSAFIGFLLEGGHIPNCVVNSGPLGNWPVGEMVDGKQRATACMAWGAGEIPAMLVNGREIWVDDLDPRSQRKCRIDIGLTFSDVHLSRHDALRLYLKLNSCGVAHTAAELDRVRAMLEKEPNN